MSRRADIAGLVLVAAAALRIATTWTVFSATADEPMHVSAGLQIYTRHAYTNGLENPPLPRLVLAFAPWMGGMEFGPDRGPGEQQQAVFHSNGRYAFNLVLARCGNLVFFLIATFCVRAWARRELGSVGALVAVLLFTAQPVIVGHAGLATPDIAAAAGLALSLLAFVRWLEVPSASRAAAFGAAFGIAVLCKFSSIGYVPAACAAILLVRFVREREARVPWRALATSLLTALVASSVVVWTGYGFSLQPFVLGIRRLISIDQAGHFAFLFGEVRTTGWWWYFPAAVGLKSTIASLLLGAAALFLSRRRVAREALLAAAAIVLVAMTSHLNIGVRHVLPLFVPLSVAGAAATLALLDRRKWIPIALLVWHTGASVLAHPDAFPYFNEAAGPRPWRLLLDSNLDWGQDALRLRDIVRAKRIERIGLAVLGWHDWDKLGFPPHYPLQREVPSQGWVAVSEHLLTVGRAAPWLEGRRYERVGTSIRLYYVP